MLSSIATTGCPDDEADNGTAADDNKPAGGGMNNRKTALKFNDDPNGKGKNGDNDDRLADGSENSVLNDGEENGEGRCDDDRDRDRSDGGKSALSGVAVVFNIDSSMIIWSRDSQSFWVVSLSCRTGSEAVRSSASKEAQTKYAVFHFALIIICFFIILVLGTTLSCVVAYSCTSEGIG